MDEIDGVVGDGKFSEITTVNISAIFEGHEFISAIKVWIGSKSNSRHSSGSFSVGRLRDAMKLTVGADSNFAVRVEGRVVPIDEGTRTESGRNLFRW